MPKRKRKRREMLIRGRKDRPYVYKFKNTKGVEYEVYFRKPNTAHFGKADGYCDDPDVRPSDGLPRIYINPYLTPKSELNTIIHEFTHAFFWDKSEKEVYKFANTVTALLYRQGWRRDDSIRNDSPPARRKKPKKKRKK
tara:strand:+ start:19283 stop:19699 length:417 start_codon:yes stop_codon:yes gene_type:complete